MVHLTRKASEQFLIVGLFEGHVVWLLLWDLRSKPGSGHVCLWYFYSLSLSGFFTHPVSTSYSLALSLTHSLSLSLPLFLTPFRLLDV